MRDWLIKAGRLITENNPKQNKPKKKYIRSNIVVNNCQHLH